MSHHDGGDLFGGDQAQAKRAMTDMFVAARAATEGAGRPARPKG